MPTLQRVSTIPVAPGALPVLGHLPAFLRDPLAFLRTLPAHGPLVTIRLGSVPVVLVCDPDLVRTMLVHDRVFDKGGPLFDRLREAGGQGLATCPAHEHRRQRRLVQPAFRTSRFPDYARIMSERMDAIVSGWRAGQTLDVTTAIRGIAADIVVSAIFGSRLDPADHHRLVTDFDTLLAGFSMHTLLPRALRGIRTPGNVRYLEATDRVRRTMARLTAEYRRRGAVPGETNLLSLLMDARDPDSDAPALSDDELVDQAVTMYSAGTETTAGAISWALYLADAHPEVRAGLTEEARTVLGGRAAGWDDVPRLGYTRQVLLEAIRMYPPGWFLTRRTESDTHLGRHAVHQGTTVAYSPYLIGRLPGLYERPDDFDPDRWRTEEGRRPQVPATVFGGGARKCVGDEFALLEGTLLLATLVDRWDIQLDPNTIKVPRIPQLTLSPGRLQATLRTPAPQRTAA